MDETTISLKYPLRVNDIEHNEITLKRPKLGHFKQCQNLSGYEQSVKMISLVSGIAQLLIEQMDMVDFLKCAKFFEDLEQDDTPSA